MTLTGFQRLCAIPAVLLGAQTIAAAQSAGDAKLLSFEVNVRPVFKAYCFDCHGGGEKVEGNLDLRLKRFAVKGGDSGAANATAPAAAG